jgi:hypothetical protein
MLAQVDTSIKFVRADFAKAEKWTVSKQTFLFFTLSDGCFPALQTLKLVLLHGRCAKHPQRCPQEPGATSTHLK